MEVGEVEKKADGRVRVRVAAEAEMWVGDERMPVLGN